MKPPREAGRSISSSFEDEDAQACPGHALPGVPSHRKVAEAELDSRSLIPAFLQDLLRRHMDAYGPRRKGPSVGETADEVTATKNLT